MLNSSSSSSGLLNTLSYEIKEQMRINAYNLVEVLIQEKHPFRLVIWNNDDWDMKLPDVIMKTFEFQLILDIKDMALEDSYIDEDTGEIILCTIFGNRNFTKKLRYDEIVGVFDLNSQPYVLNLFNQEPEEVDLINELKELGDSLVPKTIDELVELATFEGIAKESAERSINAFLKNNPGLEQKFKGTK